MTVFNASPFSSHISAIGWGEMTSKFHGEPGRETPKSEIAIVYLPLTDGQYLTTYVPSLLSVRRARTLEPPRTAIKKASPPVPRRSLSSS